LSEEIFISTDFLGIGEWKMVLTGVYTLLDNCFIFFVLRFLTLFYSIESISIQRIIFDCTHLGFLEENNFPYILPSLFHLPVLKKTCPTIASGECCASMYIQVMLSL